MWQNLVWLAVSGLEVEIIHRGRAGAQICEFLFLIHIPTYKCRMYNLVSVVVKFRVASELIPNYRNTHSKFRGLSEFGDVCRSKYLGIGTYILKESPKSTNPRILQTSTELVPISAEFQLECSTALLISQSLG